MKNIKVLGTGCAKCKNTVQVLADSAQALGIEVKIEKIEDLPQIMAYGVMSTPAVVIDETVVHKGGVPTKDQATQWLQG
ncbi:thioredoxin family protein [Oceanobacter sp. 4_MG-2023]|uniref:thioredoxin family protein n=1 Tax=Oceanobacter sp. 4_MG-2023 TaxID=3062623 RepID=UPI0027330FD5|nr:thioredoxin family protein [Oceanobacter sp. 4_MG-2023]MDP2547682.1 thioredoxin family protein [Oceanobacter sp. 4_MG-2023]